MKEKFFMRDILCDEKDCREGIDIYSEAILDNREEIKELKEDTKKGIQRHPRDNEGIIKASHYMNFDHYLKNTRAHYSLGDQVNVLEEGFIDAIQDLEKSEKEGIGYLKLLWMVSLGILLETDKENIKRLSEIIKKQNVHDFVVDYLLCACDIGWLHISNSFDKEIPYANTKEIVELAETDKDAASDILFTYMEKEWFHGHYDFEWKNAHNEPGYVGFWSFESAALAKILELDDTGLQNNNHYPYDLAHYKNTMSFQSFSLNDYLEKSDPKEFATEDWEEGIENNPSLEQIIPGKWHAFINALIGDYQTLDDDAFYDTYQKSMELEQIWFFKDEYKKENKDNNLLGHLIVFALTQRDYILQLDFKEDLEDFYIFIKSAWPDTETKLVQFVLDNDQQYFTFVPTSANITNIYEVPVKDVDQV